MYIDSLELFKMADGKDVEQTDEWMAADGNMYSYGKVVKRRCVACPESFDWDGVPYKNHCFKCYTKKVRKCGVCHVNNLKIDAKPTDMACTSCWLASRAKTHKTCPTCPPHLAHHLRCPLNKDCCAQCEARLVSVEKPPIGQ